MFVCLKVVILKEMPVVVLQIEYQWMQHIVLDDIFCKKYIITIREFPL